MKNKLLLISTGIIVFGLIFMYLYSNLVISQSQENLIEIEKMAYVTGNNVRIHIELQKDTYLLRIKHLFQDNQSKEISVNGNSVKPNISPYVFKKGAVETVYIYLPPEVIVTGKNTIEILFNENAPKDVDVRVSNYRRKIGNAIFVFFNDSALLVHTTFSFVRIVITILFLVLLLGLFTFGLSRIFSFDITTIFIHLMYSVTPFLLFLILLSLFPYLSMKYSIRISPVYFWFIGVTLCSITQVIMLIIHGYHARYKIKNDILLTFREWILARRFSEKCILLFMILLLMCAFFINFNQQLITDLLANIAYVSLVIGVIAKYILFIKEKNW